MSWGHNTLVVMAGCALLGVAAGAVGCFALLRGRALLADAIGHAALPGVVVAALIGALLGSDPRALPPLLFGGALAGAAGLWCVQRLGASGRIRQDAAIAVVIAGFYALGVVGLSVVQAWPAAAQAGLEGFILGQAAALTAADAWAAGGLALVCVAAVLALFHPLALLCFDPDFARGLGLPAARLDAALLGLVLLVCIAGLQAVGLVLVVALLVLPAATARLLVRRLQGMFALSCGIGAISAMIGVALSAARQGLPTGASVVLAGSLLFALALLWRRFRG
ncbi:MAG: metal ABC transporter permease [Rhodovarius sp.]|nr:metal ABC transporter permease [Rhodovarius sp.]MCX7932760.1 metal ABC transporter permease [Rhodovarius sp.]